MTDDQNTLTKVDFLEYMDTFKGTVYRKMNIQNREMGEMKTEIGNVKDDVEALEEKSDKFDRVNLALIAIGTAIGAYLK